MSAKKNKEILESITKANYLSLNKKAIVDAMLKQEVAGQRVFYVFLKQQHHDYKITPENMDKDQSDGIVGNTIIECKLNDKEGGGIKKAYKKAPASRPATTSAVSIRAVSITIGTSDSLRILVQISIPSTPGSMTSKRIRSGFS